jgi:Protein of unknown function (DUF1592)/Protein of unknown function (DUF1588)/Protein of unknown function (DUF1595)/Protein of unknown function (DUF1587)/Protein of unknown function (DUF1585)
VKHWFWKLPSSALLALPLACYAGVEPASDAGETQGETGVETGDGDGDSGDGDGDAVELPGPTPRVYRLTHAQWENTVQDLFDLPAQTGLSSLFRADPTVAGFIFDNDATSLEVDEALWTGYRLAAGQVAALVTEDPLVLAELMPAEGPSEPERIDAFVRGFGLEAYRRPLTEDEVTVLVDLFLAGSALYPDVDDSFVAGIRHVIEAVLQSPIFLYRVERSEAVVGEMIPLDDYEIASRLSYFLWNTMPDEVLFDAAAGGGLHTVADVADEAERMIQDPRAAEMVVRFHQQLLDADKIGSILPSPNFFPNAPADLPVLAATEHERFVRDVVFGGGGGLVELLTSSETFVEDDLAGIYGVPGVVGDEFVAVSLDPTQRKGIFTQVGFLASNATSVDPDPIHRGVFVATRMLCIEIAAPPDGIPPLPPLEPDQTNRERVEAHTSADQCATCHASYINPHGFPFESYDALGTWRTTDNNQPVDAATNVYIDGQVMPSSGALEFVELMAASPGVHTCYSRHWLEYTVGRNATPDDQLAISRLGTDSHQDQLSIQDLLIAVTTSPFFLNRSTEELP